MRRPGSPPRVPVGTALLRLPIAIDAGVPHPGLHDSLFWSTSAATVTGLGTVDVSVYWLFGELVLLALVQVGGFGIMTIGSSLAIFASRRVGLRQRMLPPTASSPTPSVTRCCAAAT